MLTSLLFSAILLRFASVGEACLRVSTPNECGCPDYKVMSRSRLAAVDPEMWTELSSGSFWAPEYSFPNCTYIQIHCPRNESGADLKLVRTNWPDGDLILTNSMRGDEPTGTLFFDVKCDATTREWKYTPVDDDRELLTEHIVCHHAAAKI